MKKNYRCCNIAVLIPLLYIFLQLGTSKVYSQNNQNQQTISGIISDQDGLPLPGVNVLIKGSSTGTMSNMDGHYSIRLSIGDTLLYSYVGYQTVEKEFTPGLNGDIIMQLSTDALSEVVINAGYYNTTERERTGSIVKVSGEEITMQPIVNPLQALQGRMPGVEITQRGDAPGMAANIRIRGQNSLRNTNDDNGNLPLYIIDGVPINSAPIASYTGSIAITGLDPLNTIGLSNIESIEILKDADATAIYGSRGANGVVLISTKKGFQKKTEINARYYTGAGQSSAKMELLDTESYLNLRRQALANDGVEPNPGNAFDLLLWNQNSYTDWQEVFFGGTSEIQDISISLHGGNKNTSFRLGGGYHKEGTILPGDFDYQKVTTALQLNHLSDNERLKANISLNYGLDTNNYLNFSSIAYSAVTLPPNAPSIYNQNGNLNWEEWSAAERNNPLAGIFNESKISGNNFIANASITYKILEGLDFKTSFGYTNFRSDELIKMPSRSYNPDEGTGENRSIHSETLRKSWIIEPQLNYVKHWNEHSFDLLLGTTFQSNENERLAMNAYGYVSENQIGNLMVAESVLVNLNRNTNYKYNAVFARFGYNWKHKVFLNLTGRRDGSSRFGANNKFANFGAIGAAWIFSEENFIKDNLPALGFGKLRGSFGTTGNDQIGDYGYFDAFEPTQAPGGLVPVQLTNPDYSWEINKKIEAALALGFFKDRITTEFTWYRNRSSNQLVGFPLPGTAGFSTVQANLPATVQNTGWEIIFETKNIRHPDFTWSSAFNISFPKNKLIEFQNIEETSYANIYKVGEPLNIDLVYRYTGIDPQTGLYTVEDINSDGSYDFEDRIFIRERGREYYGGLNNNLSFKNFSAQFLLEFVKQEATSPFFLLGNIGNATNQQKDVLHDSALQDPHQSTAAYRAYTNAGDSDFATTDASFLRLKTASLSYNIPGALTDKLNIQTARVFLNGQNLLTITPYKGLDPQIPGINIPVLRSVTAGIEINL